MEKQTDEIEEELNQEFEQKQDYKFFNKINNNNK